MTQVAPTFSNKLPCKKEAEGALTTWGGRPCDSNRSRGSEGKSAVWNFEGTGVMRTGNQQKPEGKEDPFSQAAMGIMSC